MSNEITFAELEHILPLVEKPARYCGNELYSIRKDWESVNLRLALAFPDVYEIGMSNLGMAVLYDIVNQQPDLLAERVYAPWPDMIKVLRQAGLPLFSLESRRPLTDFDMIGFSLSYELNFTTALLMLDLAKLPTLSAQRDDTLPLIIAGGSACYNPEPVAPFFDLFVIGDGEEALPDLAALYAKILAENPTAKAGSRERRLRFLHQAAALPGVYVPEFYCPEYDENGNFRALNPLLPEAPASVQARVVRQLPPPPSHPIVPYLDTVHDHATIEVRRGCAQGCRFCQAGMIYRPVRERPMPEIEESAAAIISNTGYDELGLLSLSTCDYRGIEELLLRLRQRLGNSVSISLPSLRLDSFSLKLAEMVGQKRRSGLTFAPEAGSQHLRDVINKKVSDEDLFQVAEAAFSRSWQRLKLYFMVGLPTESDEDIQGIIDLAKRVLAIGRQHHGRKATVSISLSTFVPKPHTPFQWEALVSDADLQRRQLMLRQGLRQQGLELSWHDVNMTRLEAILARGDRRLAPVLLRARELGACFDPWDDQFHWEYWAQALQESGLDPAMYTGSRMPQSPLPWDFVSTGVRRAYLLRERERALSAETTADCSQGCTGCGVDVAYGQCCWE